MQGRGRRIQVGAYPWIRVEGLMADRKISRKLKGKVLGSCVMPAYIYDLETEALTETKRGCRSERTTGLAELHE